MLLELLPLYYGWWFYSDLGDQRRRWRGKLSLAVLSVASASVILLLLAIVGSPHIPGTDTLRDDYVADLRVPVLRILLLTFVASFFQKPKLIALTAIATLGSGLFWVGSVP